MMLSLALVCWLLHTIDDICRAWSEYPISSLCVIFPVHFIRSSRAVAGAVWNKLKTWKVSFDLQPGEESVCSLGQRPNAMHITRSEENWVKESMNHENKPFLRWTKRDTYTTCFGSCRTLLFFIRFLNALTYIRVGLSLLLYMEFNKHYTTLAGTISNLTHNHRSSSRTRSRIPAALFTRDQRAIAPECSDWPILNCC